MRVFENLRKVKTGAIVVAGKASKWNPLGVKNWKITQFVVQLPAMQFIKKCVVRYYKHDPKAATALVIGFSIFIIGWPLGWDRPPNWFDDPDLHNPAWEVREDLRMKCLKDGGAWIDMDSGHVVGYDIARSRLQCGVGFFECHWAISWFITLVFVIGLIGAGLSPIFMALGESASYATPRAIPIGPAMLGIIITLFIIFGPRIDGCKAFGRAYDTVLMLPFKFGQIVHENHSGM